MLRRFASGATVASIAVSCAAMMIQFLPSEIRAHAYPILLAWVCLPTIWGLWAMLAPKNWLPERLPLWGSFLGILAGIAAVFVVDAPKIVFGFEWTLGSHCGVVLMFAALYFLLWTAVRGVLHSLARSARASLERAAD
jgi:hypothetical protein